MGARSRESGCPEYGQSNRVDSLRLLGPDRGHIFVARPIVVKEQGVVCRCRMGEMGLSSRSRSRGFLEARSGGAEA